MEENSRSASEAGTVVLETLRRRGWCLEDTDQLKAIIVIQSALADDRSKVVDFVESELLNSDLRSIGAKSLPHPSLLRNPSSHLLGPKVLQAKSSSFNFANFSFVFSFCLCCCEYCIYGSKLNGIICSCWLLQISSVRDISKSSVGGSSGGRRLLRLCLTDGHSEITAVEYSHIPVIPDDVVPGTKVMPFFICHDYEPTTDGMTWFLFPLAIMSQNFKKLCWLAYCNVDFEGRICRGLMHVWNIMIL